MRFEWDHPAGQLCSARPQWVRCLNEDQDPGGCVGGCAWQLILILLWYIQLLYMAARLENRLNTSVPLRQACAGPSLRDATAKFPSLPFLQLSPLMTVS